MAGEFVGDPKGRAFQNNGPMSATSADFYRESDMAPVPPFVEEKRPEPKRITGAPFYPMYYTAMAKTCRIYGYALTCHGSMVRDLDLVAIPWTDEAVDEKTLIDELIARHELMEGNSSQKDKPHGRRCYVFVPFGDEGCGYIDFSIMPRKV